MMTELAAGLTLKEAEKLTDDDIANALGGLPEPKYHCSNLAALALHDAIHNYRTGKNHNADAVRITKLVDNELPHPLISEHGLSLWIEYAGRNILFDTGQTDAIIKNAELLDIDLSKTDIIVLSHGHYDHTGGLKAVLEIAPNAIIYMHPDAPKVRYGCRPGKKAKDISMPDDACQKVAEMAAKNRVVYSTTRPQLLHGKLMVTGTIPRITDYEDVGGPFYLDKAAQTPDPLNDDQAIYIDLPKGLLVIVGCAHSGIVNTLDFIHTLTGQQKIYTVIGGMHLAKASQARIEKTIKAFKEYDVQKIIPLHCTGQGALEHLTDAFESRCLPLDSDIKISV
jgi:7,8-dihydropterin-6-yl-methyl-4-(beta-D-ribofuranosyl)aminobenzene 5'-phosphate synthase